MKYKQKIFIISGLCGILVWILDAILDYSVFEFGETSFLKILITSPPSHELYIRLLILLIFLIFGAIAVRLLEKQKMEQKNLDITLKSIGDGVISTDTEGKVTRMNDVAQHLTGWSLDEARGKKIDQVFNIVNAKTRETVENPVRKVFKNGKIVGLANDTLLLSKNGEEIQIADSAAPIKNEKGEIQGVVLIFRDVTKEYRQKQLIKENEEKFRTLVNQSIDAIILHDTDGNIIDVNNTALKIYGYSKEELLNLNLSEIDPEFGEMSQDNYLFEGLKIDQYKRFESEHISKDGSSIPVEVALSKVEINNKIRIMGVVRDLTEKKETKKQLYEEKEFLQQITETSPVAITKVDNSGKIVYANSEAENILGLNKSEIKGRTYDDIKWKITDFEGNPFPSDQLPFNLVKKTQKPAYDIKHAIEWPHGEKKLLSINAAPLFDQEGNFNGAVTTISDITEKKKKDQKLKYTNKLLKESQKIARLGSWEMDHRENKLTWSEETYNIFELKPEEFDPSLENFLERVHQDDREKVRRTFNQSVKNRKEGYEIEHRIITKETQKIRYLFEKCEHIKDDSGSIIRSMGIVNDITERKKAEQSLRKSKRRMKTLLSNLPGMAYRCKNDQNWTMSFISQGVLDITGYKPSEVINNKNIAYNDLILSEDREKVRKTVDNKLEKKEHFEIEYRILTKGERIRWVWERGKGIFENEEIVAIEGFISDISERKKAEQQINHLNSLLKAIRNINQLIVQEEDVEVLMQKAVDSLVETRSYTDCAVAIIDEETGKIQPVAKAADIIQDMSWALTREGEGDGPVCVKKALQTKSINYVKRGEHCASCDYTDTEDLDGFCMLNIPIFKDNSIIGILMITVDPDTEIEEDEKELLQEVTADLSFARTKIKAEEKLKRSENRLRDIFENAPVGIFRTTLEGDALEANDEMARIIGYETGEKAIEGVNDLAHQLYVSEDRRKEFIEKLKKSGQVKNFVYKARKQNGEEIWISMNARLGQEGKEKVGVIDGFAWDITAKKRAEDQVKKQLDEKETLLRELSHRTKNNMQTISSMLSLRSSKIDDERVKSELKEVEDKIYSMALVHKKLYQSENLSQIDLSGYVRDLVSHFGKAYSQKTPTRINFNMELESVKVLIDSAIPTGLALNELLSNAIEYAFVNQEEGEIKISLRREGENIILKLKDNGIGIPENFSIEEDAGMGLNIVKGLIEGQLDGEIDYNSNNGLAWKLKFEDNLYEERV